MKNKAIKFISFLILISTVCTIFFMPISNALTFENIQGTGSAANNNNASYASGSGYYVDSTSQTAIVGFRFSVVDSRKSPPCSIKNKDDFFN